MTDKPFTVACIIAGAFIGWTLGSYEVSAHFDASLLDCFFLFCHP